MSSIDRVLQVMDLFTVDQPVWSAEALIQQQGTSRATTYRDIKALVASGFLTLAGTGTYALGPRIIELDRQIRLSDPLLKIAPPIMAAERERVASTQLLCRFYGPRVVVIHVDRADERTETTFERGRAFSIFEGPPSRAILAHLTADQQRRLFLHHTDEIGRAGLGDTWPAFRKTLADIRTGSAAAENNAGAHEIVVAAPILSGPNDVTAALALVRTSEGRGACEIETLTRVALSIAGDISTALLDSRSEPKLCTDTEEPV